jgi:hypothetical protein
MTVTQKLLPSTLSPLAQLIAWTCSTFLILALSACPFVLLTALLLRWLKPQWLPDTSTWNQPRPFTEDDDDREVAEFLNLPPLTTWQLLPLLMVTFLGFSTGLIALANALNL